MKIMYKFVVILVTLIISASCVQEKMITPDPNFILSFQRDGNTDALAGTIFFVIPKGSGEFFTLFDGTEGHVWGEDGAKGIDFNKADSLGVQYSTAGKYNLTVVTSSSGNFGKDFSRSFKTIEINVVDQRNSFNAYNINGTDGAFAPNNEILFSVPDVVTDFNFVALFGLDSKDATAYVNGTLQVSGVTSNDFSQPVVYTIKSGNGTEKQYTVKFSTFPAYTDKMITKFALGIGGNGESGVIDEVAKTITMTANYATNLTAVRLVLAYSYGSTVYLNNVAYSDRKSYDLSATGLKSVKVVAQDKSEVIYTLKISSENPVTKFTFAGLVPAPLGVIDPVKKTIAIDVYTGTDITKLAALWTGTVGKVTIAGVAQTNGVTINNFTSPVLFTFYKGTARGDIYTVTVKIK